MTGGTTGPPPSQPVAGTPPIAGTPNEPTISNPVGTGPKLGSTVLQAPAPAGRVLFAFKAGLGNAEQIWLWLEGDRLHRVSTWPADDVSETVISTAGYVEGSGRFGRLGFDSQRRFLLVSERTRDPASASTRQATNRLVSYELATGTVTFTLPIDAPPSESTILTTPSTTMALVTGGIYPESRAWLFEFQGGKFVPATGADPIDLSGGYARAVVGDVAGEPVLVFHKVLRRRQGVWREVGGFEAFPFVQVEAAPNQNALCVIQHDPNAPDATVWLLSRDDIPRRLPCEGQTYSCNFSPDGTALYLPGCRSPVVSMDGQARPAPKLNMFGRARVRVGADLLTVASDEPRAGSPPTLLLFDWRTLTTRPLLPDARLPIRRGCNVAGVETPADGTGFGVVLTHCGCIDCNDGGSYALDLAARRLLPIVDPGGSLVHGTVLFGSAVVTAADGAHTPSTQGAGAAVLLSSDAKGTSVLGPLQGVDGIPHDPVAP